jgi:hypothetical protein
MQCTILSSVACPALQYFSTLFLISNFCLVLNVVFFLLGNSPASEFYMSTFRNTLFHLHRRIGMKDSVINFYVFFQFYTDSQFAAPHVRQLAVLSRSPNQLFVYKFEQSGGPDLYANTLNITGIPAWILLCLHVYVHIEGLSDHDQQRSSRFSPTVKPEAPSAIICS